MDEKKLTTADFDRLSERQRAKLMEMIRLTRSERWSLKAGFAVMYTAKAANNFCAATAKLGARVWIYAWERVGNGLIANVGAALAASFTAYALAGVASRARKDPESHEAFRRQVRLMVAGGEGGDLNLDPAAREALARAMATDPRGPMGDA
jgi:hypothetical protein